ncbi:MAG: radical SAM protein [Acidobacteria bacterium]|nr:radical SAM protein [Acidobacteriota bacterium]
MLIGIAKQARQGAVLEEKARVEYRELPTRRLLNRCAAGSLMPFDWTLNPYRGCEFGCKYCYARYTHEFMEYRDPADFERLIFAKGFDAAGFARELKAVKPGEWMAMGTATDAYQPAERRYGITRAVLEVLAWKQGYQLAITTKSDLVARDAGLLARIAQRNRVRVNMTVTTMDAALARLMEPMAPRPDLRTAAIRKLADAGVETAVFTSPVMPGINDSEESLEAVAKAAAEAGARSFGAQLLFLKECARVVFLPVLAEKYPHLSKAYSAVYGRSGYVRGEQAGRLKERVEGLRERYGLRGTKAEAVWGQLELFPRQPSGLDAEAGRRVAGRAVGLGDGDGVAVAYREVVG